MMNRWISMLAFAGAMFALIWPPGYTMAPFVMLLTSLIYWIQQRFDSTYWKLGSESLSLLFAIWLFAAVGILLDYRQGYDAQTFEIYLPFLLYPLMLGLIAKSNVDVRSLWLGAAVGAWLGIAVTIYLKIRFNLDRPSTHGTAISYGNTAILLAMASLMAWIYWPSQKRMFHHVFFLGAGICGILTSLLSGSKGGWGSVILLLGFIYVQSTKSWSRLTKICLIGMIATIISWLVFSPLSPVHERLSSAWNGFLYWWETGLDADGSVGARLNIWKLGLSVADEHPLLGMNREVLYERFAQAANAGYIDPKWADGAHMHNEMLNTYIHKGLIGLISTVLIYVVGFKNFWKHRDSSDMLTRGAASTGIMMLLMYLEFGLTDVIWQVNANRQIFIFWLIFLTGIIYTREKRVWNSN